MITPEILEYISDSLRDTMTREEITASLTAEGGWDKQDIDEAFQVITKLSGGKASEVASALPANSAPLQPVAQPSVTKSEPVVTSPRTIAPVTVGPKPMESIHIRSNAVQSIAPNTPSQQRTTSMGHVITPTRTLEQFRNEQVGASLQPATQDSVVPINIPPVQARVVAEPKAQEVLTPVLTASAPRTTIDVTEGEDFLGIFANEPSVAAPLPVTPRPIATPSLMGTSASRPMANATSVTQQRTIRTPQHQLQPAPASRPIHSVRDPDPTHPSSPRPQIVPPVASAPLRARSLAEVWAEGNTAELSASMSRAPNLPSTENAYREQVTPDDLKVIPADVIVPPVLTPSIKPRPLAQVRSLANDQKNIASPSTPIPSAQSAVAVASASMGRKKAIIIAVIALVFIGMILGGVALYFMIGGGAKPGMANSIEQLIAAKSFRYSGTLDIDLELTSTAPSGGEGIIKLNNKFSGVTGVANRAFGDGTHAIDVSGTLKTGDFSWASVFASDMKYVGDQLYVHFTKFPKDSAIDPDVLGKNWIKVNVGEIARELNIAGVENAGAYGTFGSKDTSSILGIFAKDMPVVLGDKLGEAVVGAQTNTQYVITLDPKKATTFYINVYRYLTGKELTMTDDERIRLEGLFAKGTGRVSVDDMGKLSSITFSLVPSDIVFGVRTTGKIELDLALSEYGVVVSVDTPAPYITLGELRESISTYAITRAKRERDLALSATAQEIRTALDIFYGMKGRYPNILGELESSRLLRSLASSTPLSLFTYYPYQKSDVYTKAGRCLAKAKVCPAYHLGVNLDDPTSPALATDSDIDGEISGKDTMGCVKESGKACLDLTESGVSP